MVVTAAPSVPKLSPQKEDIRCHKCGKLLFKKYSKSLRCNIEIKCKCGHVNFV